MARVTVEDCLNHVDNRFELVLVATKQARRLLRGVDSKVLRNNDKETVIALREIAEGKVTRKTLEASDLADQMPHPVAEIGNEGS